MTTAVVVVVDFLLPTRPPAVSVAKAPETASPQGTYQPMFELCRAWPPGVGTASTG